MPKQHKHTSRRRQVNLPTVAAHAFLDFSDGGAQRLTLASWRHLALDRFTPRLVCLREAGGLVPAARQQGIPTDVLGRLQRPFDFGAIPVLARWLRAHEVRIVHVALYSRASPYARLAARWARVPLVVAHEFCRPEPPKLLRRVADRLLQPGTRFIATSNHFRKQLADQGVPSRRIEVVHSGIEIEDFRPADRADARRRLGLDVDRPIVLTPARLHEMKGHLDLLEVMPRLQAAVPNVLWLCAGDGPLADDLRYRTVEQGAEDMVRFLGHRDDIPDLLAACDVVALPSHVEGVPSAMLEAFAARRAVVATDVGGVGDVLRDGREGWLVPTRDPAALVQALTAALTHTDKRAEIEENAQRRVAAHFHVRDTTQRLQSVYQSWLDEIENRQGTGSRP